MPNSRQGTYVLEIPQPCPIPAADAGGVPILDQTFQATDPSPLPELTGTVSLADQGVITVTAYDPYACSAPVQAAAVSLSIDVAEELAPFLPMTRFTLLVDGEQWATSAYGDLAAPPAPAGSGAVALHAVDRVFAACDATGTADRGTTLGEHVLTLQAHVAGADSDPEPVTLTVTLTCEAENAEDASADEDSSSSEQDAASEEEDDASAAPESSEQFGSDACAMRPGRA